jgi:hypothetical protein
VADNWAELDRLGAGTEDEKDLYRHGKRINVGTSSGWRALIAKLADRHATAVQQLFLPACHSAIQIPCKEWQ